MAGNYPDAPAPRMAYDRDGTSLYQVNYTFDSVSAMSLSDIQQINDEDDGSVRIGHEDQGSQGLGIFFPQSRELVNYFLSGTHAGTTILQLQYSNDTTNFLDGTWSDIENPFNIVTTSGNIVARTQIQSVTPVTCRAIRFNYDVSNSRGSHFTCRMLHLYGNVASAAPPDRLRIWHPTLDEPLDDNTSADGAWLDWGDVAQGTTQDKTIRIKNNSSSQTANSITISTTVLSDTTPAISPQITYSDGGAFAESINIGDLLPGETSSVITVRRTTPANATLALWTWSTDVNADSWT